MYIHRRLGPRLSESALRTEHACPPMRPSAHQLHHGISAARLARCFPPPAEASLPAADQSPRVASPFGQHYAASGSVLPWLRRAVALATWHAALPSADRRPRKHHSASRDSRHARQGWLSLAAWAGPAPPRRQPLAVRRRHCCAVALAAASSSSSKCKRSRKRNPLAKSRTRRTRRTALQSMMAAQLTIMMSHRFAPPAVAPSLI